jgi:4-amino-4-deoxy-L-arabinose transferase-like glycosyltransferase
MSLLTQSATISAPSEIDADSSPFVTVRLLQAISRFIDTRGWVAFTVVSTICGWIRLGGFASRPLDHDELYTFYIAQAPTLRQLLALTRSVDLHPPLSYLLIRASFAIFGVSSWSCRLPSVLAFFFTVALVFWLAKRALSPLYGIISVLFFWSVPFTYQADEARPYSLLLCFTTVMLVSWYRATETPDSKFISSDRRFALLTLTVGGFGLLLSHVLGVLPYAAFFAAEVVRFSIRRKSDWRLWTALLAPTISGLTYLPLIRTHSGILFTDEYHATPMRIVGFYSWSIRFLPVPLMLVALLACLWPIVRRRASQDQRQATPPAPLPAALRPLAFLLGCLALIPLGVGVLFAHTGTAFFDRYGIVVIIPVVLIPVLLLGYRTQRNQMAGISVAVVLSVTLFLNTAGKIWLIEQLGNLASPRVARYTLNVLALPTIITGQVKPRVAPHLQMALDAAPAVSNLDAIDPDLPLVANTGLTFLEIDRQGDAELTRRLYLLNDRQTAASIAHDTVFENYDHLTKVFPIRGKVEPYCAFISHHPRFLALGSYNHPQGWLLKKLDMDGADLHIIGTYAGITEDAQLYEVTVLKATCPAQP